MRLSRTFADAAAARAAEPEGFPTNSPLIQLPREGKRNVRVRACSRDIGNFSSVYISIKCARNERTPFAVGEHIERVCRDCRDLPAREMDLAEDVAKGRCFVNGIR